MTKELTGYATIDKPWKKFQPKTVAYTENELEAMYSKTIYNMLEETAIKYPHDIAINYFGIKITYKKLLDIIKMQSESLNAIGLKKDESILTILPNQPENWELIYASNRLGSQITPLLPTIAPSQVGNIIGNLEIKNLFLYKDFYEKYKKQITNSSLENIIIMDGQESIPETIKKLKALKEKLKTQEEKEMYKNPKVCLYKEFIKTGNDKKIIVPKFERNHTAAYITTSGTTGTPKLVELTNEAFNALALEHGLEVDLKRGDKSLNIMPPSIAYGFGVAHYSLVLGFESILIPYLVTKKEDLIKLWKKYRPVQFIGGPIHAELLMQAIKEDKKMEKLAKRTKNICSGGATLKYSIEEYLHDNGYNIGQGLGCTETCGGAAYNMPEIYKKGSVGIPLSLIDISIFKPGTDEELKYGMEGELCIKGPTVMKQYFNNQEETDKVLKKHKDGSIWMHTGDIATMDQDGYIYFKDRIKNIFMRTGFNIHPSKVNSYIEKISGVNESYVIGVDHPKEQQVPVAFISIDKDVNKEELKRNIEEVLREHLDEPAIPYEYVFINGRLPRNSGGKVIGKELLELSKINYEENLIPQNQTITIKTKTLN